tara:strand:+ start:6963 stop:8429 length:1467 start_codon:yes stop_codon:yes gene_type:complete
MSLWQPRSVLQLVLAGFFAALAPLCIAILFTVQTLGNLAKTDREATNVVLDVTRLGQEVQRDILELERRARQTLALNNPELAQLFEREKNSLQEKINRLQLKLPFAGIAVADVLLSLANVTVVTIPAPPVDEATGELNPALPTEAQVLASNPHLDQSFAAINEQAQALQQWLLNSVDTLLANNAAEADAVVDSLVMQMSILAATTLALLLLFAYRINKPVKDLTQEIHQLGTAGLSHKIEISGPQELQALGSKLEWLRRSLHESEQQKQQFLRHISHELKTPLSSLREGADLLDEQVTGHLSQQQHEIVTIVRNNAIELQRLIENLIDYNHLPTQEVSQQEIELEPMLKQLLENYRISIEKKQLRLSSKVVVERWWADRPKLGTTLDNLLSNAVHYTPPGGEIEILCRRQHDQLVIDVANAGEPIPEEDQERVFKPFIQSTAQRTGPLKGSGIGLSVARECIEMQGGRLSIVQHSHLPVCFRIICPAR